MLGLRNFQTQKEKLAIFESLGHLCGPGDSKGMGICLFIQQMSSNPHYVPGRS